MQSLQTSVFRKPIILACILMVLPVLSNALEIPGLKLKYGKLERSREVTNKFETYQILADHKYYTHSWGRVPYAIIGIQNKFKLRKGLWREVEATAPLLRSWIGQMDSIYGYRPYGSRILDHQGNQIGVWYSSKQWTTVVIEEDNQVAVFTPEAPGFRGGADQ
ncbi:MAG: hypothetical protein PVG06_15390 [Desulfobacterales bacterium]|jgi:hypothetical protein